MNMNLLDGFLILVCITAGVFAYRAGPLKASLSLLSAIAAVIVGIRLMAPLGGTLAGWGIFSPGFSVLLVFLLVVLIILGLSWYLLRRFAPKSAAKQGGRTLATLLGIIEAGFLLSILLLALKFLNIPDERIRSGSLLYRPMVNIAPWSFDALRNTLPGGEKVEEQLTPARRPGP
jgi:uncharacterized membrane protein required for colicin V production